MKAVVVFESLYGNTRAIADAVAEGLGEKTEVEVVEVADVTPPVVESADLLVVGGPTHIHGMSSDRSRKGAVDDARRKSQPEPDVHGPALRTWFGDLGETSGARAAAFDTRLDKPKVFTGSAAKGIAHRLVSHGYEVVGEESFLVEGTDGPLQEGELDRARAWGRQLADGS